jgi:Lrp/AsnC family transcriptional regulator
MAVKLDDLDRKILTLLQEDATRSLDEIAKTVGASKTPVWNRIKRLRSNGVIKREIAILDPEAIGLEACFFVLVRTSEHNSEWLQSFLESVKRRPEIVEAHRLAGEIDYILKVQVPNPKAYDDFYKALVRDVSIFNVTSTLSMEVIKSNAALPLPKPG